MSQVFITAGDFQEAAQEAAVALKSYPTDAIFLEQRGYALQETGQSAEARKVLSYLLLVSPKNTYAQSILGASR